MAHSTEVGSELMADHRLVEMLCRQARAEPDSACRGAVMDQVTRILDWHEMFGRKHLGVNTYGGEPRTESQIEWAHGADDALALELLISRAQRHIRIEEEHTLPAFEADADWKVLEDLGEQARAYRRFHATVA